MMFQRAALTVGVLFASLAGLVAAVDETLDPELIAKLITANSHLDQQALLEDDKDWHFDFTSSKNYNFAPGGVANMNAATFPAAKIGGMTLAMLNLGPCSLLPPHWHPNAVNFVVAILGNTTTYMYQENGARLVTEVLTPGHGTIFPRASMHLMVNTGCTNAQLVSALDSPDAGTVNVGEVFANGFPADLVNAAFGRDVAGEEARGKMPPVGTGSGWGTEECLRGCGITRPGGE